MIEAPPNLFFDRRKQLEMTPLAVLVAVNGDLSHQHAQQSIRQNPVGIAVGGRIYGKVILSDILGDFVFRSSGYVKNILIRVGHLRIQIFRKASDFLLRFEDASGLKRKIAA